MKKIIVVFIMLTALCVYAFSITPAGKAFDKGVKALNDNQLQAAKTYFNEAINHDPKFARAYSYLALVQSKLGETDDAILNYKIAYKFDKKDGATLTNLCSLLVEKGQKKNAYEVCTKAIEVNPKSYKAYNNRCQLFVEAGRYDSAIADCSQAIIIDGQYVTAYINRAIAYEHLNQYERAVEDYSSAIKINPASALAYNNRCVANRVLKKYPLAEADCSKAIALDKMFEQAYLNRAAVYEEQGQVKDAAVDYASYLKLRPDDVSVREKLKRLLEQK